MLLLHDWVENFKIKMAFQTQIFESFFKKEQRRALRTYPLLEISKFFIFEDQDAQNFLAKEYEEIYVPLDNENFKATRGTGKVTAISSISSFYFLNHLNNVYIISGDEYIAKVTSISGSNINLCSSVGGTSPLFWTALKCFTRNIDIKYITDSLLSASVNFEHIKE